MIDLVDAVHDEYLAIAFQHITTAWLIEEEFDDSIKLILFILSESEFTFQILKKSLNRT